MRLVNLLFVIVSVWLCVSQFYVITVWHSTMFAIEAFSVNRVSGHAPSASKSEKPHLPSRTYIPKHGSFDTL